jgi:PAS domain-containing protein
VLFRCSFRHQSASHHSFDRASLSAVAASGWSPQSGPGIAHLDTSGRWIRINRRFCEITGYDHDEPMEKTVDEITH